MLILLNKSRDFPSLVCGEGAQKIALSIAYDDFIFKPNMLGLYYAFVILQIGFARVLDVYDLVIFGWV